MAAPGAVLELVERFARNRAQYLNPAYNETQVRREFLDPFFTALGWDVDNTAGHAQQYKDVVHEDAIKVGLDTRAPDYSFRVGGQRKFFVEAKKPAVNLKDDPAPAYQRRRYAESTKAKKGTAEVDKAFLGEICTISAAGLIVPPSMTCCAIRGFASSIGCPKPESGRSPRICPSASSSRHMRRPSAVGCLGPSSPRICSAAYPIDRRVWPPTALTRVLPS
jgi:hypothetical protein